jgi:purine-binding chemotaxis protein CheW
LRDPTIDSIEGCPDFVTGIIRLRGQLVPAFDLRNRMGNGSDPDTDQQNWVLIAELGGQRVGLVADSVTRIMRIRAGSILPAPQIALSGATSSHIQGICESELGMLVVLDLKRLFTSDEIEAIKTMYTKLEQI